MNLDLELKNEDSTILLGNILAQALPKQYAGILVALIGEMGTGKTTLVRAMLRYLGYNGVVPSPTYTLVEPYEFDYGKIYHIDLYRINTETELEFLGWSDLSDGIMFVEWPQRIPNVLEKADIEFNINYKKSGRIVSINSLTHNGNIILKEINKYY
ncbi:MAG: tRNA (adenosine(37)-N6)-threonylcarbamoyltransferase complex ATPase subunit type 1 TsaE [Pseudomonadota bacterium]|nr:tRNA (adenosine(37)-N6)-threonylcarbamoyltransferase complex ATPase subunit type 1 TsaE [Pseudomonadota bacterium]